MFTVCTTLPQVFCSLDVLTKAAFLVLDCEGRDLGCEGGALSLLSIGTHKYTEVFVYDVVQLGHAGLLPILRLLARPDILKVVWDGRMDYNELFFAHDTTMEYVLDLQIVEVVSRTIRGEDERRRLTRLKRYFKSSAIGEDQSQFLDLQIIVGMQECLREHKLILGKNGKDAKVTRLHQTNQTELWMSRPLPHRLISYAAHDIDLIHNIYDYFYGMGYLNAFSELLTQSRRYVSIHGGVGSRPLCEDHFRSSPVLPLDVLQKPALTTYKCDRCCRKLSLHCFTVLKRFGYQRRSTACRVCLAVGKRNEEKNSDHRQLTLQWVDIN